jgi:hypothetical protein
MSKKSVKKIDTETKQQPMNEQVLSLMNKALSLLESAPQNISVRGGIVKLKLAIGSVTQAGEFQEVEKDGKEE